ncbi:Bug family tripartite tricarboxylate transporter substrate binding protein [Variovorax saccharolyticus]|uniref:Bug family tripartite tricarboxylate transporter substrate binding protein n=1 Tax=Variovorax saccharolyticus TaxID=3053516 RepID=UPI0025790405|nr:tripartite tricarboxylate transporter substrate binding protein [Variovorax sp. J22R187]MDM0022235.1 tripartite tricarboxylate transporter substrate binding protein [Variovorax sp. J22R187]
MLKSQHFMMKPFRTFFSWFALLGLVSAASAQQPAVPALIKIVVPFGAGASTDIMARAVAPQLAARLGTSVIVENRAGGSSLIGADAVAKGPRDGSMLLLTTPSTVTAAATVRTVPFDLNNDLVPVALLNEGPMVVAVSTKTDIKSPADLVAAARAKPDTVTYGTSGVGTLAHLATEALSDAAKIRMNHIPYKGAAFGVVDLAAGTIDMMLASNATFAPHIKAGRVRPIAITSREASPSFPGLPTMASSAPGFTVDIWAAVFAPTGTPAPFVQRLNREFNEIAKSKELRELALADGAIPVTLTPQDLAPRIRESFTAWKKLAAAKHIVLE